MSDLNSISITGRLTKDAVKKTFPSGKPFMTFDVANNTGFGEYAKTTFFKCMVFDKRAETLQQYLTKGKRVAVSGVIEDSSWVKDGEKIKDFTIRVWEVILLGGDKQQGELFNDEPSETLDDKLKREANEAYKGGKTNTY